MSTMIENHLADPIFGQIAAEAIIFTSSSVVTGGHPPMGPGQSSKRLSELHDFRRKSGYYKSDHIIGLDETIDRLREKDCLAKLGIIETDKGHVAVWIGEEEELLGLMIFHTI